MRLGMMRLGKAMLAALAITAASAITAQADPYRWCAKYGGGTGAATNCGFVTIDQCRAAISGNGGYCVPNPFFDGRPIATPSAQRPSKQSQR
jgi:Protein of unknown function (DUF3551)